MKPVGFSCPSPPFTSASAPVENAGPQPEFSASSRERGRYSGWRTIAGITATLSTSIAARGPRSRFQGNASYPGRGDWRVAAQYYLAAGTAVAGWPALIAGGVGVSIALWRRIVWAPLLLALPPLFYVWAVHSSGLPIYIPTLWPNTFYNTRYALAFVPLAALGTAALARQGCLTNSHPLALALFALSPFLIHPSAPSITWRESEVNSRARRQSIAQAVAWLAQMAGPHDTFLTSFGDLTPIYRALGVPLRRTLTGDNELQWNAAMARPDLFSSHRLGRGGNRGRDPDHDRPGAAPRSALPGTRAARYGERCARNRDIQTNL